MTNYTKIRLRITTVKPMVKLTVFFKDKANRSYSFESGTIHIGRDESNDLVIDSLAVAPAHAAIMIRGDGCTIKQLHNDYPLVINGKKIQESLLSNNDTIFIGKHDIVFNTAENQKLQPQEVESQVSRDVKSLNQEINTNVHIPAANLQFVDGRNIGKILPLKKTITRLELSNGGIVMITRRSEGYFISALEDQGKTTLNHQPLLDQSLKLNHNDSLTIEQSNLKFFIN